MTADLNKIITQYKRDSESVYNTWFVNNEERLKAFRSIRRGVAQVAEDIKQGKFGNDFKGSSLEFVLTCITEQKEVFEGAAHPFYWKPKLRIPDIYENEKNKAAFGQFLENVANASSGDHIVKEILQLDSLAIKGLGPAVASIIYFLHPTIILPFNTAILRGYNILFKDAKKLGSWGDYLKVREVVLDANARHKTLLSSDLGAVAGLLYEVGTLRLITGSGEYLSEAERKKLEGHTEKRHKDFMEDKNEANLHTEMQYHLMKIGKALGYDVICASNDKSRSFEGINLSSLCVPEFPPISIDPETLGTVKLIDVLWFTKGANSIIGAFEVEKSTSISSGILRLQDLALTIAGNDKVLYIIIPDDREKEILLQLSRPSIKSIAVPIKYILFSKLRENCDALCKFGESHRIMEKIANSA